MFKNPIDSSSVSLNIAYFYFEFLFPVQKAEIQHFGIVFVKTEITYKFILRTFQLWILNSHQE